MSVHEHRVEIKFGQCDPAGIVYFPRFFDFFHQAMETWFDDTLGLRYAQLILERKVGFPAVHTEADFGRPCAFGDQIVVLLRVSKVGRSSLTLDYEVRGIEDGAEEPARTTGRSVVVSMDLDPERPTYRRAVPIPEDVRSRIDSFVGAS